MGRPLQFTAEEVAEIRAIYEEWKAVRIKRIRFSKARGIRPHQFNRIGSGKLGKNPRKP